MGCDTYFVLSFCSEMKRLQSKIIFATLFLMMSLEAGHSAAIDLGSTNGSGSRQSQQYPNCCWENKSQRTRTGHSLFLVGTASDHSERDGVPFCCVCVC
jgi:hypothetical protein